MINIDAEALEAKFGKKTGAVAAPPQIADLYAPGVKGSVPSNQGQIPTGQPVPPGVIISQVVGRGQLAPSIQVVPPKQDQPNQPQMAVIPPQQGGRTSIGTFVETPKISQTTSNPLTTTPEPVNSGVAEPPLPTEPPKPAKRKKVDLTQQMLDHIFELGGEDSENAQKFYDRSPQTLKNWCRNPGTIPLQAVVKFLGKKPGVMEMIAEELEPHFAYNGDGGITSLPNRGKKDWMVLSPILERPTLPWCAVMTSLCKKYELGYEWQADTMITRSRNMLAHRFLKSGATWSLWLDGDMAAPIGNADYFRWITGSQVIPDEWARYDVLARLESHGKAVIGGVYSSRRFHGQLVIQPEIHPRHHEDKLLCNDIRKGTARGLAGVDWIGFGCAAVHREVFLEVQRRFPDLAPLTEQSPWRFFDTQGDMGEDEAFCQRLRACSIPIWLDTQLICGHIGSMAFMPEHTAAVAAI
jgi:hypothetical protein